MIIGKLSRPSVDPIVLPQELRINAKRLSPGVARLEDHCARLLFGLIHARRMLSLASSTNWNRWEFKFFREYGKKVRRALMRFGTCEFLSI